MYKYRIFTIGAICITVLSLVLFPILAETPLTFSQLNMDKDATMEKYQNDWSDLTIHFSKKTSYTFDSGDQIATITIPKMNIYELPVYYGANPVNNDWHITTPGHLGNWSLFGERGVSCIGAHNYQLFKELPSLHSGDKILIETNVDRYVYVVENSAIYDHTIDNWNTVATHHSGDYALNLMTCFPIDAIKTDDMYIVYTRLQKGTIFANENQ